jgi:urease accessory protein
MVEMSAATLALLQLCDSLFPVGSFAHSDGLESAVASGQVASSDELRAWLDASLSLALRETEAPAVRSAFIAAARTDMDAIGRIDDEMDSLRASAAGRQAARAMGTRLLKTWQHIRPSSTVALALAARKRYTFPVAFAIVCAASTIELHEALEGYCYARLAATVSAAMRLMPVGQHEAHALLAGVLGRVPACVDAVMNSDAPPRSFMPLMDIETMSHRFVHSRLFRS